MEVLDELLRRRLVEEQSGSQDRDFAFTHHKIQEVVYQSLPRHRRLHWHAQAGAALEAIYPAELGMRAGELAHHFEQACLQDRSLSCKAVTYLLQAGQQAVKQFANQEAIVYYRRGLEILKSQPETERSLRQELELQLALAVPIMAIQGYPAPETRRINDRARDLCEKLGNTTDLFTSLGRLVRYHAVTGDQGTAGRLANQMVAIAQTTQDTGMLVEACRHLGGNLTTLGRFTAARELLEQGIDLYDRAQHERFAGIFGHDPAVTCLGYLSWTLWLRGLLHGQASLYVP